jgi:Uma2 family endonuclease
MALPKKLRYKAIDIWDTPDDGLRYEVIDGELYVSPAPGERHQNASMVLSSILHVHVRTHDLGRVYAAPFGVILDEDNGVQPDIVFVSRERLDIISERGLESAPDLVVEILSPSTRRRDIGIKLRRYAASRVPHYWTLDPRRRTLEARRLVDGEYELTGVYGPGDVFRPELFPGLEIPIDDLWS